MIILQSENNHLLSKAVKASRLTFFIFSQTLLKKKKQQKKAQIVNLHLCINRHDERVKREQHLSSF